MLLALVRKFWREIVIIAFITLMAEAAIGLYSSSLAETQSNFALFVAWQLLFTLTPFIAALAAGFLLYREEEKCRLLFVPVIAITITGLLIALFSLSSMLLVADSEWVLIAMENSMPVEDAAISFLKFFEFSRTASEALLMLGAHCGFALMGSFIGKKIAAKIKRK